LVASPPDRLGAVFLGLLTLLTGGPTEAQEAPGPQLAGTVYLGEAPMPGGTVVLHHLADGSQGELDSVRAQSDGEFAFALPRSPDPGRGDVFFASVRHLGVLYFGPAITEPAQLDSVYRVQAYDTILAPAEGLPLPLSSRSVFFEPDSTGWRVTDLFQLRNDTDRTLVTRPGGVVWRHRLPAEARDVVTGQGELSFAAAEFENGSLVVRAAIPPGERLFVVRYRVGSLGIEVPNEGPTDALDLLIREPSPPVEVRGLELLDRIELEAGSTYRRYSGADVTLPVVAIVESEAAGAPRVEWVALLLALILGAVGLYVLRPAASPVGAARARSGAVAARGLDSAPSGRTDDAGTAEAADRQALLYEGARLDEDFAAADAGPAERRRYETRRAELIRRLRAL
jgi:hypothetical protein